MSSLILLRFLLSCATCFPAARSCLHGALHISAELGVVHQTSDCTVPVRDDAACLREIASGFLQVVRELLIRERVCGEAKVVGRSFYFDERTFGQSHDPAADRDRNRLLGIPLGVFVEANRDLDDAIAEKAFAADRGKAGLGPLPNERSARLTADEVSRVVDHAEVDFDASRIANGDLGDRADVHTGNPDRVPLL